MIKGIIFDLDGTLLNTFEDIRKTLNQSLQKFSLPQVSAEQTKNFIGDGAKNLVYRAAGEGKEDLAEKVLADYLIRFAACDNSLTTLYEGEDQALKNFATNNIKMAVVTNKPQRSTDNVFNKYLSEYGFCEVLGQTEYYPLKPNPASTLAVLSKMGIKKEECLYVGDGDADVACAANAGIRCISVLWGYRTKEQLIAAGAKNFVSSYYELERLVKSY